MMKKKFVAPQLQVMVLCEDDILTLSTMEKADAMILELGGIFESH